MLRGTLAATTLHECDKCYGVWLDSVTFEQICRDSEQQAAILGSANAVTNAAAGGLAPVRYLRCPQCRQLMHRVNFARCSGVVVDVCREHGTWFDMNELQRIVQFIRSGGIEQSRERQKRELEAERRRLQSARMEIGRMPSPPATAQIDLLSMVVGAAGELLGELGRD